MPPTTHADSEDEDDFDYVPPADEHDSDSADEQHKGIDEPARPKTSDTAEQQQKRRDALWASFQVSVSGSPSSGSGNVSGDGDGGQPPPAKRIRIEKTFLFAGKHVTEVVEVPENSEEAKKWPRWTPTPAKPDPTTCSPAATPDPRALPVVDSSSATATTTSSPPPATPNTKRPGPRKPRTTLPSLPPKAQHAKKITTLDKSAMDWRTHVSSQAGDVKDELDANRRGGGYLEKVDFLQRVQGRREDAFEASKSGKRRRA